MKNLFIFGTLVAVFMGSMLHTSAQDEPMDAKAEASEESSMPVIPQLLSSAKYLTNKKPNLKAQYYMFLRSASWCVPCQIFVPRLLKDYSKMKGAKVELIFLGQEDEAVVKKYMDEHKYKCPGVMPGALGTIPGVKFEGLGYPSMCLVDAHGNFIACNGGTNMLKWRKIIKEHKKKEMLEKRAAKKKAASLE